METIKENISQELRSTKEKYRSKVDLLLNRIGLLRGEDKLLMIMYWEKGNSLRQISRLAGVDRKHVTRRIYNITERLMDGPYIDCLRYRDKFTLRQMAIAKDYFLSGLSAHKIAGKYKSSYYRARNDLQKIRCILENVKSDSTARELPEYENKELSTEKGGTADADI